MEDDGFSASTMQGTLSDNMDFDLMDELLYDGCWLETTDGHGSNFLTSGFLSSSPSSFPLFPTSETSSDHLHLNQHQKGFVKEANKSNFSESQSLSCHQMEEYSESQRQDKEAILTSTSSGQCQSESFVIKGTEMNRKLWIGPSKTASPATSVKKRLMQAIDYLKELAIDSDALIQIWVPIRRGGKHFLTTSNQPFSYNPNYESLVSYRDVSRRYKFSADADSKGSKGLPGRVFLKRLPEWTPDVRLFRTEEYPRLRYAQQYSVSGCLALPVFERGSGTCLGVIEIVTTTQKANYRPELENAVDLRSSEIMSPSRAKDCNESYQAALAEILDVLKSACDSHKLPLAQTWAPCVQQAKGGCRHSDENYGFCVSTVDYACYVPDQKVWDFHVACSEHHMLSGEGIAGGAFMTNQPCFATDITSFSKTEYPLSHHAKMFELSAAVAIRLRSIYTGSADFVLEFFLPRDCKDVEEQKQMLSSLSSVIFVYRTLRVVTDQEMLEESGFVVRDRIAAAGCILAEKNTINVVSSPSKEPSQDESSWITHMTEAQRKGKSVAISLGYPRDEPGEKSKMTNNWGTTEAELHYGWEFSEHNQIEKDSGSKGNAADPGEHIPIGEHCHSSAARNTGEKRRTKTEKTISLQELRRYFAGSLKDAAKSIGVCPTTLKRICRQHGITRWPSRKIKKVGHSLRKLQLVIDSVQGAEGNIKLSSFYTNFPELSSPNSYGKSHSPTSKKDDHLTLSNTGIEGRLLSPQGTASKSRSSSGSHSSSSSFCCSTGTARQQVITSSIGDPFSADNLGGLLKGADDDADLNILSHEETKFRVRSQGHASSSERPYEARTTLPYSSIQDLLGAFRVKVNHGDEKIRFSMQKHWGFGDLQREIARRFNIYDVTKINLKYLDDDSEWVLLTCDADLDECIDIHKSSKSCTINLSLHEALNSTLGSSFGGCGPS